ncbi:hypothetical protein KR222_003032 [Zaprionus bogoriensis]|nr:hypothetical protein KR222_003032 [Zaprionus bogoriensis]
MFRFIFLLIFSCVLCGRGHSFEVRFQESYPDYRLASDLDAESMRLHKRQMQQFFDKATYNFDGLVRVASVPVPFPLDICMLQLPNVKYAVALHKDAAGVRHFAVYVWRAQEQDYALLLQQPAPKAVALDCLAYAGLGYIALSYNHTERVELAREGSPIYELSPNLTLRTVQYFGVLRLRAMYLRISSQELTLLQAYESSAGWKQQRCPYFKWTGGTFQRLGAFPCSNARHMEAFGIDYTDYVAVANYASADGRTATDSEVYRYNATTRRFQLFQRLRSNGAVDVKYFSLPVNEVSRRHFLILGNTVGGGASGGSGGEADTVIYVYDNGQFVPYQRLSFYALERFLPVTHVISEKFLLFVACNKQDVKIYNLNDWKFEESTVQFTEGAFSRGVARLRSYEENEQSYLGKYTKIIPVIYQLEIALKNDIPKVIANENMEANETNIFQPLYKQDEHANILRQEIIDWAREQTKRLEQLNVQHVLQALQVRTIIYTNFPVLINILLYLPAKTSYNSPSQFVDAQRHLSKNYWEALQYAKRALDVIEHDAAGAEHHAVKREAEAPKKQHEFDEITVGTLVVHEQLKAAHINGIDSQRPEFEAVNATKVFVSGEFKQAQEEEEPTMEQLTLQELQLAGRLNGYNWSQLLEQTLKRRGNEVQFIKAAVDITNLKADAVLVNTNEVNDRSLGQLVSIDGGSYIVQQDVQFAQPVEVNQLVINERLNHIHVDRQRFDVLLHEANHTQVIVGAKRLEHVRVLEPVTIAVSCLLENSTPNHMTQDNPRQGQLLGAELRAMSPMKVTHQSLELQGDYVIDGDVTIGQLLQLQDLREASTQRSTAEILQQALRIDQPLENVNLRFEQPLEANDTTMSFINAQDMQQLVQLNVEAVQVLEGTKWLPQSLTIDHGFAEVNILNDIQVDQLSQRLLLKSGNQSFVFPMQLAGLDAPQVNATELLLNGLQLQHYLQRNGAQHSTGKLYVDQLVADELHVKQLQMHGTLYGQTPERLYERGAERRHSWQLPADFNGTIQARNVWLKGRINNVSVERIEQQLQQLAGNIKYVGDFTFRHAMNISALSFGSSFNGIEAQRFGRCWLETSGDQQFTAPLTLAALASDQDVQLLGRLNNYTLEQLVSDSYRLNGTEQLQAVKFVNPIVLQRPIQVGYVNGLRVPEDMLYAQLDGMLQAPMQIKGQLVLPAQQLCNVSQLNGLPLDALAHYLDKGAEAELDTLHVEQAQFDEGAPSYERLNGHRMEQLLEQLWLDNEHVELRGVHLASASFQGLLEYEGALNGLEVNHIGSKYFSRTRSQRLSVPLSFEHDVTFAQAPTAQQVQLRVKDGALVEGKGNVSLDFDDFVSHTLKTSGAHTITGQWRIPEAHVAGNLHGVLINQLNLVDDILRNDSSEIITIEAPKFAERASIQRLFATPDSLVAQVPVVQWINNAVYIYGNHSIAGTTILETLNLYNDLCVKGPVNGFHWQPQQLLLREQDQQIRGSLQVHNTIAAQQRLLSHNIAELWVDRINGLPVNELLANKAHNRPNLHVASQLVFTQPLSVANYQWGDVTPIYSSPKWKRGTQPNAGEDWRQLSQQVAAVQQRLTDATYVLDNFELVQFLPLNASHLELLKFADQDAGQDLLGIWHTNGEGVQQQDVYNWQPSQQSFKHNPGKLDYTMLSNATFLCPLQLEALLDCLAVQRANQTLLIYCSSNGTVRRRAEIATGQAVKQLAALATDNGALLALRGHNAVELWQCSDNSCALLQRLNVMQTQQVALAQHEEQLYLAVLTAPPAAVVHIYRAERRQADWQLQLQQSFDLVEQASLPRQLQFVELLESKDLLLCLSNASPKQSLRIYQEQGITGFQQIIGDSTLPAVLQLEMLQLPAAQAQLLALISGDGVYLVAPQFTRL